MYLFEFKVVENETEMWIDWRLGSESSEILVESIKGDKNFLVIKEKGSETYFLNKDRVIEIRVRKANQ